MEDDLSSGVCVVMTLVVRW